LLERIIAINNVGVIRSGVPRPVDLDKVALIYADNARGKSTLSSLLRACSEFDAKSVAGRTTFGSMAPQRVQLRFKGPAKSFNADFDGNTWSGLAPRMFVFNQEFVERNVYAGSGVEPEHRANLLEFALGSTAVAQRAEFEKQGALQREKAGEVSSLSGALQGYRGSYSVDEFLQLEEAPDTAAQLAGVDKQLADAKNADQIRKRPLFRKAVVPQFDFSGPRAVMAQSFESVATSSEEQVRKHLDLHNGQSTERWVAEGMHHKPDEGCPFCGQATQGLELLDAYKSYFNAAYKQQLAAVTELPGRIDAVLSERFLDDWSKAIEFNLGAHSSWESSFSLGVLPSIDVEEARAALRTARAKLIEVVKAKSNSPLAAAATTPYDEADSALAALVEMAQEFNSQIEGINEQLEEYQKSLLTIDEAALAAKRARLVSLQRRFEPEVVELVAKVLAARIAYGNAETAKDEAKTKLDEQMDQTLAQFQVAINTWLEKFAAPFTVEDLASTYKGGGVRSEYVLKVRGATVTVGPGKVGDLGFHEALSEGDKRTLAFSFFLARLFADPTRQGAAVVLDDVFTSLDRHRRHETADAVVRMAAECSEVIVLGHDAHFLKEVKKRVGKKNAGPTVQLALHRDGNDFSVLDTFDIDDYCASDYYKHYVLVDRFVGGDRTAQLLEVAKALRPLLEGHLHRCFPKKLRDGGTVGEMLDCIKNADDNSALGKLKVHLPDLVAFNDFASSYHHDTAGSETRTEVNATELLRWAKGALGFIQHRAFR
jgi:wobble nucleotide-excising tRNase